MHFSFFLFSFFKKNVFRCFPILLSTFVCPTEIIAFSDRAEEFRKINCEVVACSVDSHFCHLAWYEKGFFKAFVLVLCSRPGKNMIIILPTAVIQCPICIVAELQSLESFFLHFEIRSCLIAVMSAVPSACCTL